MAHINIHFRPRQVWTWDWFRSHHVTSVALDGMVDGPPSFCPKKWVANFDHHSGVVREATMSTAKQVLFAIKGGFVKYCTMPIIDVYANDIDQDTSLALWLLQNHHLIEGANSIPNLNRLIELNDRLDITGGAYPMYLNDDVLKSHNWIFDPYTQARKSGRLSKMDLEEMRICYDAIAYRLTMFMMGSGDKLPGALLASPEILQQTPNYWVYHEKNGNDDRYALFSQGMDAYVAVLPADVSGPYKYVIGKRSQYIPFPVQKLFAALNEAEAFPEGHDPQDVWGGSDLIGGSPRLSGSKLKYAEVVGTVALELARLKDLECVGV